MRSISERLRNMVANQGDPNPTDKEIIDAVVNALGEARLWIIADAGEDDIIIRKIDAALALARGE